MSAGDYGEAFPNSRKVYVEGRAGETAVAVPMREIALSGGEPPLRVYDTSGPRGVDVRRGLPLVPARLGRRARRREPRGRVSSCRPRGRARCRRPLPSGPGWR